MTVAFRPLRNPNPLGFPGGVLPGFDPTHVALSGGLCLFSGVAWGATFANILSGTLAGTLTGSPTAKLFEGIGPAFGTISGGNQSAEFVGSYASSVTTLTLAGIFQQSTFQNSGSMVATSNAAGTSAAFIRQSSSGAINPVFGATSPGSTTFVCPTDVPYFLAVSMLATNPTIGNFVLVNLATGQITYETHNFANSSSQVPTNYWIGANPQRLFSAEQYTAAAMIATTFLSRERLLAWAADPWSFWYPRRDTMLVGAAAAAFKAYWANQNNYPILGTGTY